MNEFLRYVTKDDIDLLYEWANDKETRKNSFSMNKISYQQHKKWFSEMLLNDSCFQYIYMAGDIPVGQIRLLIQEDTAEVSYSVDSAWRGKGYGKRMLHSLLQQIKNENLKLRTLTAKVKPSNEASKKVFTASGFCRKYEFYEIAFDQFEDISAIFREGK
ncbi:MAG: GNAT family N-acetyltransferase [Eubacterium sp.]|nr:GNAT family N-acetyltransferase [Eubacterium sp.]